MKNWTLNLRIWLRLHFCLTARHTLRSRCARLPFLHLPALQHLGHGPAVCKAVEPAASFRILQYFTWPFSAPRLDMLQMCRLSTLLVSSVFVFVSHLCHRPVGAAEPSAHFMLYYSLARLPIEITPFALSVAVFFHSGTSPVSRILVQKGVPYLFCHVSARAGKAPRGFGPEVFSVFTNTASQRQLPRL